MGTARGIFTSVAIAGFLVAGVHNSVIADGELNVSTLKCTQSCTDCHVASDDPSGVRGSSTSSDAPTTAFHLIGGASATETCLRCHDGQKGIPDVVGKDINNPDERMDGTERAAGFFPESVADNARGHNAPGTDGKGVSSCTVCHDPHGNTNYRYLRNLDASYRGPVAFVKPGATGLDRYRRTNVGYACNFSGQLCLPCHSCAWSGCMESSDRGGRFQRHPNNTEETVVTLAAPCNDSQHWVRGKGSGFEIEGQPVPRLPFAVHTARTFEEATQLSENNEVFCLSCHKAHGSGNTYGMQWPYASGKGLERSAGCNQCHNVGGDL